MEFSFPFAIDDLDKHEVEKLVHIYNQLKTSYTFNVDFGFSFDLHRFDTFAYNKLIYSGPVFKVVANSQPFYLNFLKLSYPAQNSRYGPNEEFQTWGYLRLKNDYGRILITTETILDKIYDLLTPIDVDFKEDKEFSQRFFVVTTDKEQTRQKLTSDIRNIIKQLELHEGRIEINGYDLIIGNKKVATEENSRQIADFLTKLTLDF